MKPVTPLSARAGSGYGGRWRGWRWRGSTATTHIPPANKDIPTFVQIVGIIPKRLLHIRGKHHPLPIGGTIGARRIEEIEGCCSRIRINQGTMVAVTPHGMICARRRDRDNLIIPCPPRREVLRVNIVWPVVHPKCRDHNRLEVISRCAVIPRAVIRHIDFLWKHEWRNQFPGSRVRGVQITVDPLCRVVVG